MPELRQRWPVRSLAMFGSIVRGEANSASDFDILVEFGQPIGLSPFLALGRQLCALTERRVDLVSRTALKPDIAWHVVGEALQV